MSSLRLTHDLRVFASSADEPAVASHDVHRKEDAVISASLETKLQTLSIRNQKFLYRPEYVSGTPIKLRTNYFEVQVNPKAQIFRYTVAIANFNTAQKRMKRHIIELLLEHPVLRAAKPVLATDFNGLIVTGKELNLERTRGEAQMQDFDVQYRVCSTLTLHECRPSKS